MLLSNIKNYIKKRIMKTIIKENPNKLHWRGIIECQEVSNSFINEYSNKIQG